ncbi:hypothetical protein [Hansschlegelia sp. KR7-227]|jgi:hypothetical protein|uniref:hypothetical protein n=1 Tax=Hansschlegelia sp. KR7-227 TaxID=3400914 RepID=UPI003C031287
MKTFASALAAAAFAVALTSSAFACPYSNKSASLTDGGSYETAQNGTGASSSQTK